MSDDTEVRSLLEQLAGQEARPQTPLPPIAHLLSQGGTGLGYSQLNELLLLYGFDRVTHAFFQYLIDGKTAYCQGNAIPTVDALRNGVARFRRMALLLYGNVKYAFKSLSRDVGRLDEALESLVPIPEVDFMSRHDAIHAIEPIAAQDAYLTGYMVEGELRKRLLRNPGDPEAGALEERRRQVVEVATRNQTAYLASDHLDVYVATSMRARHEFSSVSRLTQAIFSDPQVKDLRLRWFDPTQAYCSERIDKGLSEALMLRRATCTIYFVQEGDTLGKDSELASTLAQGKPVVAFVPEVDDTYFNEYLEVLSESSPGLKRVDVLLDQLRIVNPHDAWKDPVVQGWIRDPATIDEGDLKARFRASLGSKYDERAKALRETHPLGIEPPISLDSDLG